MLVMPRQVSNYVDIHESRPLYFYTLVLLMFLVGFVGTNFFENKDNLLNGYELSAAAGDSSAPAVTYYVSANNGSDTNNGTSIDTPFKTIQKAANLAVAGDTVYIRGGTYREDVRIKNSGTPGNLIKFFAYQNEKPILKATDIVTGWTQYQGNIWKKDGWNYNSQQVFVDFDSHEGPPLEQIGNPPYSSYKTNMGSRNGVAVPDRTLADIKAGSFYYDTGTGTLYVWLADGGDPNNHVMDVGKRQRNLSPDQVGSYIHIKGLTVRFGNTGITNAFPTIFAHTGSIIEDCDIQWADEVGVSVYSGKIINNIIKNNGLTGVGSFGPNNVISGNRIQNNNYRHYLISHLGGLKLIPDFGGIIENNIITDNYATGLWIDTNYVPGVSSGPQVTIRYNFFKGNRRDPANSIFNKPGGISIHYEISENGLIHDNIIVGDDVQGIYLSSSQNNKVFNNSIVGIRSYDSIGSAVEIGNRYNLINNAIRNNLVYQPNSTNRMMLLWNGYAFANDAYNNTSDYNLFKSDTGFNIVANGPGPSPTFYTLPSWQAFGGQDTHSVNADPKIAGGSASSASSANDIKLQWNSPAIDAGTVISGVDRTRDYFGNPIYGTPDIGAAEYQPPYDIQEDHPDIGANVRIYGNGMYRNKNNPSGTTANITFYPASGLSTRNYMQWLDLGITSWGTSKTWTLNISNIGDTVTVTKVGDLSSNATYQITVDGTHTGISGTGYTEGVVKTDASGIAAFAYTGTGSHTFNIAPYTGTPTPAQNDTPVAPIRVISTRPIIRPDQPAANQPQQQAAAPLPPEDETFKGLISSTIAGAPTACTNGNTWSDYTIPGGFFFRQSLGEGDTGEEVKVLQYILARESLLAPVAITSTYDFRTRDAVKELQKKYGIVPYPENVKNPNLGYGDLGQRTRIALNLAMNKGRYNRTTCGATTQVAAGTAPAVATGLPTTEYTPNTTTYVSTGKFTVPLRLGMTHPDVKRLQSFLNSKGFTVATSGNGSLGRETTYFGNATRAALIRFQEFYRADVLTPANLAKGSGYFGGYSMKKVNFLLGY